MTFRQAVNFKRYKTKAIAVFVLMTLTIYAKSWPQNQTAASPSATIHSKGGKLERPSAARVQKFRAAAERRLGRRVFAFHGGANPTQAVFSWRTSIPFNVQEDQGQHCGSCYIFGGVGALEENWAMQHPGKSISASQQLVLNCTGTCSGGYLSTVMEFLINKGTGSAADYPYTGAPSGCTFSTPLPYTGLAAEYVASDGGMPTEADLKAAIMKYGPVGAFIYAGGAFDSWDKPETSVITDDSSGAANGHIILITGWNDAIGAWEIKNSWGATWGDKGFAYVKKGTRDIGDNAMWIVAAP